MTLLRTVTTPSIMLEMDDNYLSTSDNIYTQLHIKVNLRVVSTVCPLDSTVTQPLHNKPNTDDLLANIALAVMDLIHFAHLILQKLYNSLLTKREDVVCRFFQTTATITRLTIEGAPGADPHTSQFDRSPFLPNAIADIMFTKDEKGTHFCVSFRDAFESSSVTTRCPAPTASS